MNLESIAEGHFRRCTPQQRLLFFSMLAQELCELRFRYREVRSAQALPNFFVVGVCPGIIATRFMAHQVLLASFFPDFDRLCFGGGFHGLVSLFTLTVENNREN